MGSYRIRETAKADLERIYRCGVREFGDAQADRYFNSFFKHLKQLAERPYAYPAINDIRAGYRRSICGVDNVDYRVIDDVVEIMTILGRQDVDKWLGNQFGNQ